MEPLAHLPPKALKSNSGSSLGQGTSVWIPQRTGAFGHFLVTLEPSEHRRMPDPSPEVHWEAGREREEGEEETQEQAPCSLW